MIKTKTYGRYTYNFEIFDSIYDFSRSLHSRNVNHGWERMSSHSTYRTDWYGTSSFEEADDLLQNGWSKYVGKVLSEVKNFTRTSLASKTEYFGDVVGFLPNVPSALMNVPNSMINSRKKFVSSKILTVVYDVTADCGVSTETLLNAGTELIKAIIKLELSGYRVNLYITSGCVDSGADKVISFLLKLKGSNTQMNIKSMMYPLANSSFLRRHEFYWLETSPFTNYGYISGYGMPIYAALRDDGDVSKKNIEEFVGNNCHYITVRDSRKGYENIVSILENNK